MTKAKQNLIARYKALIKAHQAALHLKYNTADAVLKFRGKNISRLVRVIQAATQAASAYSKAWRQYSKVHDQIKKVFKVGVFAAPRGEVLVLAAEWVFFTKVVK